MNTFSTNHVERHRCPSFRRCKTLSCFHLSLTHKHLFPSLSDSRYVVIFGLSNRVTAIISLETQDRLWWQRVNISLEGNLHSVIYTICCQIILKAYMNRNHLHFTLHIYSVWSVLKGCCCSAAHDLCSSCERGWFYFIIAEDWGWRPDQPVARRPRARVYCDKRPKKTNDPGGRAPPDGNPPT